MFLNFENEAGYKKNDVVNYVGLWDENGTLICVCYKRVRIYGVIIQYLFKYLRIL